MSMLQTLDNLIPTTSKYESATIEPIIIGNFELRLAVNNQDIEAAQRLRYKVFYEEMGANPNQKTAHMRLDRDKYDDGADHLLVIDRSSKGQNFRSSENTVVGTYRLLKKHQTIQGQHFYSGSEYDISKILKFEGNILELGRSCVDSQYRSRTILQLMWQGIASYVLNNNINLMFGCASFPGQNIEKLRHSLYYLNKNHLAPAVFCPKALADRYIDMSIKPANPKSIKSIINDLPPLIKGYLRIGGWVGDGAVIDHQFNTTDVCILVKTNKMPKKYQNHYMRKFSISTSHFE